MAAGDTTARSTPSFGAQRRRHAGGGFQIEREAARPPVGNVLVGGKQVDLWSVRLGGAADLHDRRPPVGQDHAGNPLFRTHADGTIKADHLAVEVGVFHDVAHQAGEFGRLAGTREKRDHAAEGVTDLLGQPQQQGVSMRPGAMAITRMP